MNLILLIDLIFIFVLYDLGAIYVHEFLYFPFICFSWIYINNVFFFFFNNF